MAITTLDGVVAGRVPPMPYAKTGLSSGALGRHYSTFLHVGFPGAGSMGGVPASGNIIENIAPVTLAGTFRPPSVAAGQYAYIDRFSATMNVPGVISLHDRLWHCSGFAAASTTAQAINSPAWPPRDCNNTINGVGVQIALEVSLAMSIGAPIITMTYTNSNGVAGRTASISGFTGAAAGTFLPFPLMAGDIGVKSVQSIQQSATWTSGAYGFVAYRTVATMEIASANMGNAIDAITGGLPALADKSALFITMLLAIGTVPSISGTLQFTVG